ncbi:cob(I)yrinic acid a,c-diamide adenosyltransferase [Streptomyces massasporeus]|uniref:cob(I)yrinic acid a,c-diamide adenosyltransferase n=1 Tax=Streptomyces massasporeus TaxID=67324 RepID=UPI0036E09A63
MTQGRNEKPIVLSRIYTRTGDDGTTSLGNGSRVSKTDVRITAYADVDEANCAIGQAISLGELSSDMRKLLFRIQNDLFDLGADLCNPSEGTTKSKNALRVTDEYVNALERACDVYNTNLSTLRSFVLPGGAVGAVLLHTARAMVRRAERSTWSALSEYGESMNPLTAKYLNRLSDLLFILARQANIEVGDLLWNPGGSQGAP